MYDEDNSSEGGSKGSYEIFKAEGDVLFKKEEFQKALTSYSTALDLRQGDKNCLVARSQCYLELGNADAALADAEATLSDDKNFIQGLKQKAEALYTKGNFEFALVFYQRGYKLRPEVKEFRLGIQKAQEAIENSIGDTANLHLKNEGDLSYFFEEEQKKKAIKKQKGGYSRNVKKKELEKQDRKDRPSGKDSKTIKQLLGELYADKEYLERLWEDTETANNNDTNDDIHGLAADALDYLDSRAEFWQQQKPMYARKGKGGKGGGKADKSDPAKYILKSLEDIDEAQANGKFPDSLKKAKRVLKEVEGMSEDDVPNREEVVANLHSLIGNAHLEMGDFAKAKEHHNKDKEIAEQHDLEDAKSRALDNLGRVNARAGEYEDAISVWEEKLPLSKSALESTWLHHEIGRCHLELGRFTEAKESGEKSLEAATEANDDVWQLNANVLVAQSLVKLEDHYAALDAFESSLEMAKKQKDNLAESAIKKAIDEVNQKIAKKEKGEDYGEEEEEKEEKADDYEDDDFEKEISASSTNQSTSDLSSHSNESKNRNVVGNRSDQSGKGRISNTSGNLESKNDSVTITLNRQQSCSENDETGKDRLTSRVTSAVGRDPNGDAFGSEADKVSMRSDQSAANAEEAPDDQANVKEEIITEDKNFTEIIENVEQEEEDVHRSIDLNEVKNTADTMDYLYVSAAYGKKGSISEGSIETIELGSDTHLVVNIEGKGEPAEDDTNEEVAEEVEEKEEVGLENQNQNFKLSNLEQGQSISESEVFQDEKTIQLGKRHDGQVEGEANEEGLKEWDRVSQKDSMDIINENPPKLHISFDADVPLADTRSKTPENMEEKDSLENKSNDEGGESNIEIIDTSYYQIAENTDSLRDKVNEGENYGIPDDHSRHDQVEPENLSKGSDVTTAYEKSSVVTKIYPRENQNLEKQSEVDVKQNNESLANDPDEDVDMEKDREKNSLYAMGNEGGFLMTEVDYDMVFSKVETKNPSTSEGSELQQAGSEQDTARSHGSKVSIQEPEKAADHEQPANQDTARSEVSVKSTVSSKSNKSTARSVNSHSSNKSGSQGQYDVSASNQNEGSETGTKEDTKTTHTTKGDDDKQSNQGDGENGYQGNQEGEGETAEEQKEEDQQQTEEDEEKDKEKDKDKDKDKEEQKED